jgi:protein-tyrosine phosphatase
VIDLHCHILPGLDDGPADLDGSTAMARVAEAAGIRTMVATPHIRHDYSFPIGEPSVRAQALAEHLKQEDVGVSVIAAGEVSISKCGELADSELAQVSLGDGPWLLVESPYTHATDLLEHQLFDIQRRGFQPILAHPERSPSLMEDDARLATLVRRGVACSITADSLTGRFGRTVARAAIKMVRQGLVHDVASDSHDARRRAPGFRQAVEVIESSVPGMRGRGAWFVEDGPAAFLAGEERPEPPQSASRRRIRLRGRRAESG